MEKLCEVGDFVVDNLLVVQVVVRLEVDSSIRDEEEPFDLDEWQNLLDPELLLKLCPFTDVLQSTLVEFDFLVGHYTTCSVAICCVVQTLGHEREDLLYLCVLVMKLVTSRHICAEEQTQCLAKIVDVAKSNVDVEAILFGPVISSENVSLVRLRRCCIARNFDQFGDLDREWKLSLGRLYTLIQSEEKHFISNLRMRGSRAKFLNKYLTIGARGSLTNSMIRLRDPKCTLAS